MTPCFLVCVLSLIERSQNALGYHCDKGLLSSLVSWIVAGNVTPSFIEGNANPTQVQKRCHLGRTRDVPVSFLEAPDKPVLEAGWACWGVT